MKAVRLNYSLQHWRSVTQMLADAWYTTAILILKLPSLDRNKARITVGSLELGSCIDIVQRRMS